MIDCIEQFTKTKPWLVCIDSDGCAMDTMDIKHIRCFGPELIKEWGLEDYQEKLLSRWNNINLYSMTRGINRFKGLSLILKEINESVAEINGLIEFSRWTDCTKVLSNDSLESAVREADAGHENTVCMKKALNWSRRVNAAVSSLDKSLLVPFPGVPEAIARIHQWCDVAVVSSANKDAVYEEWIRTGLAPYVDIVLCQDIGSKTTCISRLLEKGYDPDFVLMIGDAPGDMQAAESNNILFYPILVRLEPESWSAAEDAVKRLMDGTFAGIYQQELKERFVHNLQRD